MQGAEGEGVQGADLRALRCFWGAPVGSEVPRGCQGASDWGWGLPPGVPGRGVPTWAPWGAAGFAPGGIPVPSQHLLARSPAPASTRKRALGATGCVAPTLLPAASSTGVSQGTPREQCPVCVPCPPPIPCQLQPQPLPARRLRRHGPGREGTEVSPGGQEDPGRGQNVPRVGHWVPREQVRSMRVLEVGRDVPREAKRVSDVPEEGRRSPQRGSGGLWCPKRGRMSPGGTKDVQRGQEVSGGGMDGLEETKSSPMGPNWEQRGQRAPRGV